MRFTVLLWLAFTANAVQSRVASDGANMNTTTMTDGISARAFSWTHLGASINDLLVLKKNIVMAYPFEIAATTIDVLCSATLYFHHVPQKIIPDIRKMSFQYVTPCRNYSVPLLEADNLWRHAQFSRTKRVVILATGWTNTVNDSSTLATISRAFMCRHDVNFIIVDAASYVDTLYKWAALNTEEIGEHIAVGLTQLVKLVPLRNIHLIGHSLGAHIMGAAGRTFAKLTHRLVPRITGLDPAKPCFRRNAALQSLHRGDARLVDVIHTNIGILAKREPIGDVDFYPGGANALPPGCLTIGCAHARAVEYFAESVYPGNERNFRGHHCASWNALKSLKCSGSYVSMGYALQLPAKGIYYVDVNGRSPFGKSTAGGDNKDTSQRKCAARAKSLCARWSDEAKPN